MRRPAGGSERGIAVLTAMLVVTIATILAVEIAWQTNLDLRRTEGLMSWEQARQFGYGAEAFAIVLMEDKLESLGGEPYSRSDDEDACGGFRFEIEQGGMLGGVCDLQGRFNLNNLIAGGKKNEVTVRQFRRLLAAVDTLDDTLEITPDVAEVIVESAVDWIDPDSDSEFNGAEADAYTSLQPPYRAANFWFTSVSELRAVRGVTPEIYRAVAPHLAALPLASAGKTLLNINTVTIPVMMSLGDGVSLANAEQAIFDLAETPAGDAQDLALEIDPELSSFLDVKTNFFELKGLVSIGTTQLGMYSLLEYAGQSVVARSRQFDVVDAIPRDAATELAAEDEGEDEVDESDE